MNMLIKAKKFLVKQFSTFNVAHLLKFVVNFNLIIFSKPKYIVILTGIFCSVVTSGTSHFYSFFRKWFWQELIFGMTNMTFGLGKPSSGQKRECE